MGQYKINQLSRVAILQNFHRTLIELVTGGLGWHSNIQTAVFFVLQPAVCQIHRNLCFSNPGRRLHNHHKCFFRCESLVCFNRLCLNRARAIPMFKGVHLSKGLCLSKGTPAQPPQLSQSFFSLHLHSCEVIVRFLPFITISKTSFI